MGFDLLLLMFPKKIWDFGLAYNSFTLLSLYLGKVEIDFFAPFFLLLIAEKFHIIKFV